MRQERRTVLFYLYTGEPIVNAFNAFDAIFFPAQRPLALQAHNSACQRIVANFSEIFLPYARARSYGSFRMGAVSHFEDGFTSACFAFGAVELSWLADAIGGEKEHRDRSEIDRQG